MAEPITINPNIFPVLMSILIGEPGSPEFQKIDLPRGVNILYLRSIKNPTEIKLLKKYANKEDFSDEE